MCSRPVWFPVYHRTPVYHSWLQIHNVLMLRGRISLCTQVNNVPGSWIAAFSPEANGKEKNWEAVMETSHGGTNILCCVPVAGLDLDFQQELPRLECMVLEVLYNVYSCIKAVVDDQSQYTSVFDAEWDKTCYTTLLETKSCKSVWFRILYTLTNVSSMWLFSGVNIFTGSTKICTLINPVQKQCLKRGRKRCTLESFEVLCLAGHLPVVTLLTVKFASSECSLPVQLPNPCQIY